MRKMRILTVGIMMVFYQMTAAANPGCKDLLSTPPMWSDSVSQYFHVHDGTKQTTDKIHQVYHRASVRFYDSDYPESFTPFQIALQDAFHLEIARNTLLHFNSGIGALSVLQVEPGNKFGLMGQHFDVRIKDYINSNFPAPTIILEYKKGIRLIELIDWLNSHRTMTSTRTTGFDLKAASEIVESYNESVLHLYHAFETSLNVIAEEINVSLEENSVVPYYNLIVTLIDQRSFLPSSRVYFSVTPSNTIVTDEGELILISSGE